MYMQTVINLGKYLFAIPLFIFGLMHLMSADQMAPWRQEVHLWFILPAYVFWQDQFLL